MAASLGLGPVGKGLGRGCLCRGECGPAGGLAGRRGEGKVWFQVLMLCLPKCLHPEGRIQGLEFSHVTDRWRSRFRAGLHGDGPVCETAMHRHKPSAVARACLTCAGGTSCEMTSRLKHCPLCEGLVPFCFKGKRGHKLLRNVMALSTAWIGCQGKRNLWLLYGKSNGKRRLLLKGGTA